MRRVLLLLSVFVTILPLSALTIKGKVFSTSGEPIPYATVSLIKDTTTLLGATCTAENGSYTLEADCHSCILRASYVGYQTQEIHVNVGNSNVLTQNIVLREDTSQLAEVTVVGNGRLIERRMDKIVMNVSALPMAIGNNGKEILKKAPGVHVDKDGAVTVNGKSVEIYIDGRPSYQSGEQLKAMLENTDGSTIDRIEIITQPSAKYDAAGQGGIIDIRTKHNKSRGLNGSLSVDYGGMYWNSLKQYTQNEEASLNLNYRGAKGYTSFQFSQALGDGLITGETSTTTPQQQLRSYSRNNYHGQYYMAKFTRDFYLDSLNTLGFMLSATPYYMKGHDLPADNYSEIWQGDTLLSVNTEDRNSRRNWLHHTANLNFTHVFSKEKDAEIRLNFDYDRNNTKSQVDDQIQYVLEEPYTMVQDNRYTTDIYNARIDYQTDFWRTGKIECGAKWLTTRTNYHSSLDSAMTELIYTEHVAALYITAGKQFGKHWSTKLGLRGEYTYSVGDWKSADSCTTRSYFNLFPTAFVGYQPTDSWSISINYTRRIQRPWYGMLNPANELQGSHYQRRGNTELMPAYTHNVKLSVGYSEYVTFDLEYSHTHDWMTYKTTILPSGDHLTQAMNYGNNNFWGANLSLTEIPLVKKWLTLSSYLSAHRSAYKSYDGLVDTHCWMGYARAALTLYAPKNWMASVDGSYSTPGTWGTERERAYYDMNLAVKKDFPKLGLTLTARVDDLLQSSHWHSTTIGLPDGYSNLDTGNWYGHTVTIGVVYKFGRAQEYRHHRTESVDADRSSGSSDSSHGH